MCFGTLADDTAGGTDGVTLAGAGAGDRRAVVIVGAETPNCQTRTHHLVNIQSTPTLSRYTIQNLLGKSGFTVC